MNIEPEYLARCGVSDYIDTETVVKEHVRLAHKENDVLVVENSFNENLDVENDTAGNTESQANLSTGHHWTDEEVKLFLFLYEQHKQDFEERKLTNRSIWLKISRTMN
ncbi:hypothetical protein QE152_g31146 [Popillia japonica]|uniref:Uncharacterized protein n=1 Tax=Popillia japonica TaxID=7064 RepID=A0AAW1JC50_POPJA